MNFTQYYKLGEDAKEDLGESDLLSIDQLKAYVDDKFSSIESALGTEKETIHFNVVPATGKGQLSVIDVNREAVVGSINVGGRLISSPVVNNDQVSFAIQTADKVEGVVYDLRSMAKVGQFPVGDVETGHEYREVMGRTDDIDDDLLGIDPEDAAEFKGDIEGLDSRVDSIEGRDTPGKVEHSPPRLSPQRKTPPTLSIDVPDGIENKVE